MAGGEHSSNPPGWSNCRKRLENEGAVLETAMGNGQRARTEIATAPENDVEVKDTRCPVSRTAPPECALYRLDLPQHDWRLEIAFDQSDAIGEIASGPADCGI